MKKDFFLTKIMNFECGIANFENKNDLNNLNKFKFAFAKTKVNTTNSIFALKNNFYLADTTVNLRLNLSDNYDIFTKKNYVNLAENKHKNMIINLAKESFIYDRFHSDPNIPYDIASKIKGEWINNYFNEIRGDKCFVILSNNSEVKGFLLTLKKKNEIVIDLIAVNKQFQKEGVGSDLIKGMINYYKKYFSIYSVGTQISNVNSLKLYQRFGFNIYEYGYTWHYFNDKKF